MGLLTPTAARHVARLPQDNQKEFLQLIHREALTVHELEDVVGLMLSARSVEQQLQRAAATARTASGHGRD